MSTLNSFADTIAAAEKRGRDQVVEIVRQSFPSSDVDFVETRIREVTASKTGVKNPSPPRDGITAADFAPVSASAARSEMRPFGRSTGKAESKAAV